MRKVIMTVCVLLAAASAWGEEPAKAPEQCVDEKIQVQMLMQENAQLRILAAPAMYNQATQERLRLEKLKQPSPDAPKPEEPKQ